MCCCGKTAVREDNGLVVVSADDSVENLYFADSTGIALCFNVVAYFVRLEEEYQYTAGKVLECAAQCHTYCNAGGGEEGIEELTSEKKPSFLKRLFHHNKKVQEAIDEWNEKKKAKISAMLPKVERGPSVIVDELADSAIIVVVRAWVRTENYWSVFYEYNERFYNELPSAGINFPFPQM